MEALIRILCWGQRGENRKIHWLKWQELCKPKSPRTSLNSMMPYQPNKRGDSCMTLVLCFTGFLRLNTSLAVQLWRQRIQAQLHMRGRALLRAQKSSREARCGELETGPQSEFGKIDGYLIDIQGRLYLLASLRYQKQQSACLSIQQLVRGSLKCWKNICQNLRQQQLGQSLCVEPNSKISSSGPLIRMEHTQ